jgi:hypothetical protein
VIGVISAEGMRQHRLFAGKLCGNRLFDVQTVVQQRLTIVFDGQGAGQETRIGSEGVTREGAPQSRGIADEASPQR